MVSVLGSSNSCNSGSSRLAVLLGRVAFMASLQGMATVPAGRADTWSAISPGVVNHTRER